MFTRKRQSKHKTCAAVILAAGASTRMGGGDKLMLLVAGRPVLAHTLAAFESASEIDKIVIVTRSESIVLVQDLCREYGISKASEVVAGGSTRTESALAGALAAGKCDLVAIHDGARPLISPDLIARVYAAAAEGGAAAPGVPLSDTVKLVDSGGLVLKTPDREAFRAVQTPQIFDSAIIKGALTRAATSGESFTDDCAAVEAIGMSVRIVDGARDNIKITTPLDIAVMEALV